MHMQLAGCEQDLQHALVMVQSAGETAERAEGWMLDPAMGSVRLTQRASSKGKPGGDYQEAPVDGLTTSTELSSAAADAPAPEFAPLNWLAAAGVLGWTCPCQHRWTGSGGWITVCQGQSSAHLPWPVRHWQVFDRQPGQLNPQSTSFSG